MPAVDEYFAFHLFAAHFSSQAEAELFAFEQWAPQPAADASDAEFSAWEERNPSWRLQQELGFYMDADFVELVGREDCPQYLESLIRSAAQRQQLRAHVDGYSHFILVASQSLYGDRLAAAGDAPQRQPASSASLDYLGEFNGGQA